MSYHLPIVLFLLPFATAISLPLIGSRFRSWCRPLALTALSAMCVGAVVNLTLFLENGETRYPLSGWPISTELPVHPLGIEWVNDGLASVMVIVLSFLSWLCVFYSGPVAPQLGGRTVLYYTLILIMISGLTGLVFAGDIFNVFVFLELAALSAYALVGISGGRSLIAAFRYLILGSLGSSFYLLGIIFLYATTGTLNMADLSQQLAVRPELMSSKAVIGGTTFMFIGFGIKIALFPLHSWLPGAYARAPDAISPMLAALMTKVALYAWVRILFWVLGAGAEFGQVHVLTLLGVLGAIAAVAGALMALCQEDLKRMFAYGGISHIGLILVGVSQGNETGFAGSMFYLINDAVMQAGLFFIAGAAIHQHQVRTLADVSRLRRSPWIVGSMIVMALSMIGIPPTGGFFGKWHIILGALEANNYPAVAAIVVATLLTMAYFQRFFVRVFADASPRVADTELHPSLRLSVGLTAAVVIVLGLCSDPMISFFLGTAESALKFTAG